MAGGRAQNFGAVRCAQDQRHLVGPRRHDGALVQVRSGFGGHWLIASAIWSTLPAHLFWLTQTGSYVAL